MVSNILYTPSFLHPFSLCADRQWKEEEEKRRQFVLKECERVMQQKDLVIRLQPLGVDRNHDRYWLFNATTPGLYVEKGWVDHHTTYSTQVRRMLIMFSPPHSLITLLPLKALR